jgi:predicted nuclease of predicted toxin-antitoxin system
VKVKLDENVSAAAKHLFETHGHKCDTAADEHLTGTPDAKLIDVCRDEQRILVTFDLGFGDLRVYPPSQHAGIVLLRLRDQQPSATLRVLAGLLATRDLSELANRLTIVSEDRVRVRLDESKPS